MLDKVTRWVLCLPDNAVARSEGHVPFFAFTAIIKQLADKDQKRGSQFSLAIMSEYSYAA